MSNKITLCEMVVILRPDDGLRFNKWQYYTKFTGQNYIQHSDRKYNLTDEEYKQGFRELSHRVRPDELMVVDGGSCRSSDTHFSRYIYYLPENEKAAKELLYNTVATDLSKMKVNVDKMMETWLNRPATNNL
jgi:hypothetical protein